VSEGSQRALRALCPVCRHRCRLRKDGTLTAHHFGGGPDCTGSGGPPVPYDPDACGPCLEYRFMTPGLAEACYSVGIEVGKDGGALLREVLEAYHQRGHREPV
jgi:hypothetical protein